MAWQFVVNQSPVNGGTHVWNFVSALMLAGWTMQDGGTGTGGTRGATVVNSAIQMAKSRAWVRMQAPDGGRELCIQRGTGHGAASQFWWIRYSKAAHFVTGGDEQTMPTATDGVNVWGWGTGGATIAAIANGYRFTIARTGGWIAPPTFSVVAVDGGGNKL